MIIVEGPDGAGKTTLVKSILENWNISSDVELELVPRSVSKDAKALTQMDDYIETELSRGFGNRLYDRFALLSAPCYAMLPDRTFSGRMWDVEWLSTQYYKLAGVAPVLIYCLPSLETVKANLATHDGVNLDEQIELIYINYVNQIASLKYEYGTSMMVWDYENPNWVRLGNLMRWAKARIVKGR